jgi:type I restriction enzyme S subunit
MRIDVPTGWSSTTMREYVSFFTSGDPFLKLEYSSAGIPVLAKGDVKPFGRIEHGDKRFIPSGLAAERGYRLTQAGDYLLTTRDLTQEADFLGLLASVPLDKQFLVNQGANVVRFSDAVDGRYVVYWCNAPAYRSYIKGHHVGSTQIHIRKEDFLNAPLLLPPLLEQRAIAQILGGLDDKIDLNCRLNSTLDAIARTVFTSWFVDFDPVHAKAEGRDPPLPKQIANLFPDSFDDSELGRIPKGWSVEPLENITSYLNRGLSPAYIEEGGIRVLNQKCIRGCRIDTSLARRHDPCRKSITGRTLSVGDILLNSTGVGTLGRVAQVIELDEETIVDSHVTVVRANAATMTWNFLGIALCAREQEIEGLGEGSTGQTELSRSRLARLPVVTPSSNVMTEFDRLCIPLRKRIAANENASRTLAELRDALLPKLMSGALRIQDAERIVGRSL